LATKRPVVHKGHAVFVVFEVGIVGVVVVISINTAAAFVRRLSSSSLAGFGRFLALYSAYKSKETPLIRWKL
jgi:hypothetical protein